MSAEFVLLNGINGKMNKTEKGRRLVENFETYFQLPYQEQENAANEYDVRLFFYFLIKTKEFKINRIPMWAFAFVAWIDEAETNFVIPNGVLSIKEGAFAGFRHDLTIPTSVREIDRNTLGHIRGEIYYKGTIRQWQRIEKEENIDKVIHCKDGNTIFCK